MVGPTLEIYSQYLTNPAVKALKYPLSLVAL